MNDEGAMKVPASKKKTVNKVYPWKEHIKKEKDDDGNYTIEVETGKMLIQPKMKDVLDRPVGKNEVTLMGAGNVRIPLSTAPEIGNGSKIKAKMFVNPYYMPSTNTIGVSLNLEAIKIYDLVEYGGAGSGEDFDDDDGYVFDEASQQVDEDKLDF